MKMKEFDRLVKVVATLRKKCPWDREQTHETLKPYMVEEVYEAIEAIDSGDRRKLCEELGDMLLHIVMHAEMGRGEKTFNIKDVVKVITAKMIRRHPHVFGGKKTKELSEIWEKWEEIKKAEAGEKHKGILESVPQSLPALYRADKVQRRAARVGFDWDLVVGAWSKVREEVGEIEEVLGKHAKSRLKEEIGDLLFAIVNVTRKSEIDAEEALQSATSKFMRRFREIEKKASEKGVKVKELGIKCMDKIWEDVKKNER